jgi:hypothetical protein
MLFDKQNLMLDKTAVTVTAISNVIDIRGGPSAATIAMAGYVAGATTDTLGNTPVDDPARSEVDIIVTVAETFTAAGAATLTLELVADTAVDLVTSPQSLQLTAAIPKATLVQGYQIPFRLPLGILAAKKYLGIKLTVGTGPMTAGKLTAAIIGDDGRQTAPGSGL